MTWKQVLGVGLAASLLTACTVSVSGGLLGALATAGLTLALLAFAGASQTGCVEDPSPSPDDAGVDPDVGPCLTDLMTPCLSADMFIGPCLGAPLQDAGPDLTVGPCLSRPLEDAGPEIDAGPCLTDMAPFDAAIGPCLEPPPVDAGVDGSPDAQIGPCLDVPEPEPMPDAGAQRVIDSGAVFAKVTAGLPADVVARLVRPSDKV